MVEFFGWLGSMVRRLGSKEPYKQWEIAVVYIFVLVVWMVILLSGRGCDDYYPPP